MRDDLEATPVHRSLLTPTLIFGVERKIFGPLLGLSLALVVAFRPNFVTPTLGVLLLTVGLTALRRVARRDPWAFRVLRAHLQTAGFYPAQARHDVVRRPPPTFR